MLDPNFWREKLVPYTGKSNAIGARQVVLTFIPFVFLWVGYAYCIEISRWFVVPFCVFISLFILRFFVLMHDCGHNSLFKSRRANQVVGFLLGVITGMPQYVWSKNHTYHHNTNGDWVKYGGVFNIISTERYTQLSKKNQKRYWRMRQPSILIPAGFFYVLFNPRFNWLLGTAITLGNVLKSVVVLDFSTAAVTVRKWETK